MPILTVKANLKLYSGNNKRQTAFKSGYRPLFQISKDNKVSGMIMLLDRDKLYPGEEATVEIKFTENYVSVGMLIYFYENIEKLGEVLIEGVI